MMKKLITLITLLVSFTCVYGQLDITKRNVTGTENFNVRSDTVLNSGEVGIMVSDSTQFAIDSSKNYTDAQILSSSGLFTETTYNFEKTNSTKNLMYSRESHIESGSYNVLLGGWKDAIPDGKYGNLFGGGQRNYYNADWSFGGGGQDNYINNVNYGFFGAGNSNYSSGLNSFWNSGRYDTIYSSFGGTLGGLGLYSYDGGEITLGYYNTKATGDLNWHIDNRAFSIGNGTSHAARSNAFEIYFNGDVKIRDTLLIPYIQEHSTGGVATLPYWKDIIKEQTFTDTIFLNYLHTEYNDYTVSTPDTIFYNYDSALTVTTAAINFIGAGEILNFGAAIQKGSLFDSTSDMSNLTIFSQQRGKVFYNIQYQYLSDTTIPYYVSSVITGENDTTIKLTYSEILDESSIPVTTDFSYKFNGDVRDITNVSIASTIVSLRIDTAATSEDTLLISYTKGINPIQDLLSNDAVNLVDSSVTNNLVAGVDADAQAYIDSVETLGGVLSPVNEAAIDQLVKDLKGLGNSPNSSNLWDSIDQMILVIGNDREGSFLNLKDPRNLDIAFRATLGAGAALDSTKTIFEIGVTEYMDTKYDLANNTVNGYNRVFIYYGKIGGSSSHWGVNETATSQMRSVKVGTTMYLDYGNTSASSGRISGTLTTPADSALLMLYHASSPTYKEMYDSTNLVGSNTVSEFLPDLPTIDIYVGKINTDGTPSETNAGDLRLWAIMKSYVDANGRDDLIYCLSTFIVATGKDH